jgi:hypothetical protein
MARPFTVSSRQHLSQWVPDPREHEGTRPVGNSAVHPRISREESQGRRALIKLTRQLAAGAYSISQRHTAAAMLRFQDWHKSSRQWMATNKPRAQPQPPIYTSRYYLDYYSLIRHARKSTQRAWRGGVSAGWLSRPCWARSAARKIPCRN